MYLEIKYIVLNIKVFTNSNRNHIEFINDYIKIHITSAPKHNRANIHTMKMLSELFNVSINNVIIIQGKNSSNKKIKIINPEKIPFKLPHDFFYYNN